MLERKRTVHTPEYAVIDKRKLLADMRIGIDLIESGLVQDGRNHLDHLREWIRSDTYTGLIEND